MTLRADTHLNITNTPAGGSWSFFIRYTYTGSQDIQHLAIRYLSNGDIDRILTSNTTLATLNWLFEPAIALFRNAASRQGITLDYWEFMNWVVVSEYWILLHELGQTQPTMYPPMRDAPLPEPYTADFSRAIFFEPTNNIFMNASLFDIYSTYLSNTILPLIGLPSVQFDPLTEENKLNAAPTTIVHSYTCQVRQLKEPVTAFFAVLTTIYVFTTGPFHLIIFIAAWFKTRRNEQGFLPLVRTSLKM